MSSKNTIHVTSGPRPGYGPFIDETKGILAGVVIVDQLGAADEVYEANPNALIVGRSEKRRRDPENAAITINPAGMDIWVEMGVTPEDAAQRYYDAYVDIWRASPKINIWITFNEWAAHREWQARFYIALIRISIRENDPWKYAIFSESSGNPPDFLQPQSIQARAWRYIRNLSRGNDWAVQQMIPALQVAKQTDNYLCLHEYGDGIEGSYPYHTGRYKFLFEILRQHDADPALLITESGFVEYPGDDMFIARAKFTDDLYAGDEFVKLSAMFTVGKWFQAGIPVEGLRKLAKHIVTYTPPDTPPDPEPPEEPKITTVVNVLPQDSNGIQEDAVLHEVAGDRQTLLWSLHNARDIVKLGKPQSYVVVWGGPEHWKNEGGYIGVADFIEWHDVRFRQFPGETETGVLECIYPVKGERIVTSPFGPRPGMGDGFHYGVDLLAPLGQRVLAAAEGVVDKVTVDTAANGGYGKYVRIKHKRGPNTYHTYYGHLDSDPELMFVDRGTKVNAGFHIAYSGNTGNSTGPHLHWGLKKNGKYVDPLPYLRADQRPDDAQPPTEPTHKPLALLHLKAESGGTIADDAWQTDMEMLKDAGMDGAKWTTNNQVESIAWVRNSTGLKTENMIARLYSAGDNQSLTNAEFWFGEQYKWIDWAQAADMLIEIHNEPNLLEEWPRDESNFARWFADVATMIHARWPNARVGFPGLSPQPNTKAFYEACYDAIRAHADWVGVHCYFSADGSGAFGIDNDSADQAGGLYHQRIIEWIPPNIPIWITEFADNGDGPDVDRARRTAEYFSKQYPLRVKGLACYISQDANFPKQQWVSNPHMVEAVRGR